MRVVPTRTALSWARAALSDTVVRRQLAGATVPPDLHRALEEVESLLATFGGVASDTELRSSAIELRDEDWIGTAEAARIIGCSAGYVRRIADRLGGQRASERCWVYQRSAVSEYAASRD
jgi:hypothetical protein